MAEWLASGRPVLVSDRGGLGEVAGVYPGSRSLEPTVESIVERVAALREPDSWRELVAAVQPLEGLEPDEWGAKHAALYESIVG
jgi:hypothetical protein